MNNLAIIPYIGMHALQIQNVKREVVKKASINELNSEMNDSKVVANETGIINNNNDNNDSNNSNNSNNNNNNNNDINNSNETTYTNDYNDLTANKSNAGTDISNLPEPATIDTDNYGSQLD
jgi:hypothetical protein